MKCRHCLEQMEFDVDFDDDNQVFYKRHYCLECDYFKDEYSMEFHKECAEANREYEMLQTDFYKSVIV